MGNSTSANSTSANSTSANSASASQSSERTHDRYVTVTVHQLQKRILEQDGIIKQLEEDIQKAESTNLVLNETINTQGIIIRQMRQSIRTQGVARQTEERTQATQTDQDDVYFGSHGMSLLPAPNLTSRAEYNHSVTDIWIYAFIQRPIHAQPLGISNRSAIKVFNASKMTWFTRPKSIFNTQIKPTLPQLAVGEKIYYHGSSDGYVKSIIEHGIDVSKSTRATDFSCGGGFYVTKNFGKAVEWSKRRAVWDKGRPAVIAFKISRSLRKEEPHLALRVDNSTNRKWWECVVSHFRHSEMSLDVRKVLADVKFIKGPVANNKYVGLDENPRPFDFTQLCIRDEEYALRFGSLENIAFVIFSV